MGLFYIKCTFVMCRQATEGKCCALELNWLIYGSTMNQHFAYIYAFCSYPVVSETMIANTVNDRLATAAISLHTTRAWYT